MFAPVVTLIFYFLQPGGSFIDAADPADGAATIAAMVSNAGLGKVVSIVIPIGLLVFLSGILVLQENVRSNGNGGALSRIAVLFILVGIIGWVVSAGVSLAIIGSTQPIEQAVPFTASLYSATLGIGTVAGILWGIGTLALALAISTREDSNKIAALVAAVAAVVAIVVTIIGGLDTAQLELMTQITGITFIVHVVWFFMLGRSLSQSE
tara:strand:+ start:343 stop:969 length:627 start_codon:yes stop_codon:yes gene_type:complete